MQDQQIKKHSNIFEGGMNKIQQIWKMQKDIGDRFRNDPINEKCIFLVGDTNVGKTTLLYYLTGMKLNLIENKIKKTKEMKPQTIYQNAFISNAKSSTTIVPNIFSVTNQQSKKATKSDISLIDMPGMNDNRFLSLVSNIFTFRQIFQQMQTIKKIHIALVISEEMFDALDIKENLREFVEHFNVDTFEEVKCMSIIFTKTQSDLESLKETFFQYLEQIKEDIEEDEEDIGIFIDILQGLNETQEVFYVFPKQEPNQQHGQQITLLISQRDAFIDNDKPSMILNKKIVQNALLSSKHKVSGFESNFYQLMSQSFETIKKIMEFTVKFVRITHKNVSKQLFETEDSFKEQKDKFCLEYADIIDAFSRKEKGDNDEEGLSQDLDGICKMLVEDKMLYKINRSIKETFNVEEKNEEIQGLASSDVNFSIRLAKSLSLTFGFIQKTISKLNENSIFSQVTKEISLFLDWISHIWLKSLIKVEQLPKISNQLKQIDIELKNYQQNLWEWFTKSNQNFFETFNKFSELGQGNEEEQFEDQGQQVEQIVQFVMTPGSLTLKEMKEKYIKQTKQQEIDQIIKTTKDLSKAEVISLSQQAEIEATLKPIVQNLLQKVLQFNKSFSQPSKDPQSRKLTDDELARIFFMMKNLRHRVFLESALQNFTSYLKFLFYAMKMQGSRQQSSNKLIEVFNKFIDNMCKVLEQYGLYEEEVLLYLFVSEYEKVLDVLMKGFQRGRIGKRFVCDVLIVKLEQLLEMKKVQMDEQKKQYFSQIFTKCYNYLIAQFSTSRQQQSKYQTQLFLHLDTINSIKSLPSNPLSSPFNIQMNDSVMDSKSFSIKNICEKINLIQKRNSSLRIHRAYKMLLEKEQGKEIVRK